MYTYLFPCFPVVADTPDLKEKLEQAFRPGKGWSQILYPNNVKTHWEGSLKIFFCKEKNRIFSPGFDFISKKTRYMDFSPSYRKPTQANIVIAKWPPKCPPL